MRAERAPASDGLPTGPGSRVMDGGGPGCLQAGCESFMSVFIPVLALCITQKRDPVPPPGREIQAGKHLSEGRRELHPLCPNRVEKTHP